MTINVSMRYFRRLKVEDPSVGRDDIMKKSALRLSGESRRTIVMETGPYYSLDINLSTTVYPKSHHRQNPTLQENCPRQWKGGDICRVDIY